MSNQPNTKAQKKQRPFPIYIYVIWGILALSVAVSIAALISERFADFYNRYPGAAVRAILAYATNLFPLSVTEIILILLPSIVTLSIVYIIRRTHPTFKSAMRFCVLILSCASLFFSVFVLGFGCGYHGSTLDQKLGLEKKPVSVSELEETSIWLAEGVTNEIKNIQFEEKSSSIMPYSLYQLNTKLLKAYDKVCDKYDFIQRLTSRVKPVMLSEAMSYTHITGVYTYFSGEANLNVDFPDYTLPFTAAHELAHQRGIAREDEANFVAFLVCINSDDPYIRYCGYLNMFEYVAPKINSSSPTKYAEVFSRLPEEARYEVYAYAEFFKKYEHSIAGEISESVNNGYLQMQGTPGTKSYGLVVDLTVAYYNAKIKN